MKVAVYAIALNEVRFVERFMASAREADLVVVADTGSTDGTAAALDREGVVVHLGTFSKTLAPGLRVAWAVGPIDVLRAMTVAKQASDLHSASLTQRAVSALFERFDYEAHLTTLRRVYGERRTVMLAALDRHMPAGTGWTRPEGGMFTWVELPGRLRAEDIFEAALAEKVAFVPGSPFYAVEKRHDTLRLNFSNRPPERIDEGMGRLGRVVGRWAGEGRRING